MDQQAVSAPGASTPGALFCSGTLGAWGSSSRVVLTLPECGWGLLPQLLSLRLSLRPLHLA